MEISEKIHEVIVRDVTVVIIVPERLDRPVAAFERYREVIEASGRSVDFLFVFDGVNLPVRENVRRLQQVDSSISMLSFPEPFGRAACLREAVQRAQGKLILLLPAYEQVATADLPSLLDGMADADVVVARRDRTTDNFFNRWRGSTYRLVTRVAGSHYEDLGCEVRCFRPEIFGDLLIQDGHDVFLPILAKRAGYVVKEIVVRQADQDRLPRSHRFSNYFASTLNLLALAFLIKFTYRPFRFFGAVGFALVALGAVIGLELVVDRLFFEVSLGDRPMLLLAVLLPMLGIQIAAVGLIAEIVIFTRSSTNPIYRIREVIEATSPQAPANDQAQLHSANL
jgi:hypothetical protein